MRYIPSLPPPFTVSTDRWGTKPTARVGAVKRVQERTLPPLVFQQRRHAQPESLPESSAASLHAQPVLEDRRTCCRRVMHLPVLEEFRSGVDRRRRNQRKGDITEHVDLKV